MAGSGAIDGARLDRLVAALAAAVEPEHVITDPAVAVSYGHDLAGRYNGRPLLVVRPGGSRRSLRSSVPAPRPEWR